MNKLKYPIALEGLGVMSLFLLFTLFSLLYLPPFITTICGMLLLWSVWFFRNPKREPLTDSKNSIISPADGQIVMVGPSQEETFLQKEMNKISIFMNVLNVHINRAPVDAVVEDISYKEGKFRIASHHLASSENEQNAMLLRWNGLQLVLVQIAGKVARRIVSYAHVGTELKSGEAFGLIKFGSRVDLYLPSHIQILVQPGQKVTGGQTILAKKN